MLSFNKITDILFSFFLSSFRRFLFWTFNVLLVLLFLVIDLAVVGFDMQSGKISCLSLLLVYSRLSSFYRIR